MASPVARIGAVAGWIGLLGIFGYHLLLQGLFGPRVSGTLDVAAVTDFYRHDAIAWITPFGGVTLCFVLEEGGF